MTNPKVSVIIPAYNEEAGIEATIRELVDSVPDNYEIIVIDDGSKDDTYLKASSVEFDRLRIVRHQRNKGYGTAIKTGTRHANGDVVVWYDSDGQHRPCDLLGVVNKLIDEDLDYCIGIRTADSHVDKNRKFGKKVLSFIANKMAKEPMPDVNSGLRAFKKEVLYRHLHLLPKRFGASTVTTFIAQEMDYEGGEYPITVRKREGTSTVKPVRDGLATLKLIMNIVLLFRAKEVLSKIAIVMVAVGTIYGLWSALTQHLGIPVLSAILVLFGVQMYFFGIISAQISALRLENRG